MSAAQGLKEGAKSKIECGLTKLTIWVIAGLKFSRIAAVYSIHRFGMPVLDDRSAGIIRVRHAKMKFVLEQFHRFCADIELMEFCC